MITRKLVTQSSSFTRVYAVEGVEPVPMSGTEPTRYTPTSVRVTIYDGRPSVTVWGRRVLKSGRLGQNETTIRSLTYGDERKRPEWLADIVAETVRASA